MAHHATQHRQALKAFEVHREKCFAQRPKVGVAQGTFIGRAFFARVWQAAACEIEQRIAAPGLAENRHPAGPHTRRKLPGSNSQIEMVENGIVPDAVESRRRPNGRRSRRLDKVILHHLDLTVAARELRRVLRPGGVAVFCEPWGGNPLLNFARRRLPYAGKRTHGR